MHTVTTTVPLFNYIGKLEHEGVRYYKLQDIQCSNPKSSIFVFKERDKMYLFDE